MGWSYTSMSEEDAKKASDYPRLPDGVYPFYVEEQKEGVSNKGFPKIDLVIKITHEGVDYKVFPILSGTEKMAWYLRHFCASVGILDEYEQDLFIPQMCFGKRGYAKVKFVPERPNPEGGVWKSKNEVEDWLTKEEAIEVKRLMAMQGSEKTKAKAANSAKTAKVANGSPLDGADDGFDDDDLPF